MISNSVTHLWSYTNTAIANIAGNSVLISPETPRKLRCRHANVSASRADVVMSPHQTPMSPHPVL